MLTYMFKMNGFLNTFTLFLRYEILFECKTNYFTILETVMLNDHE